MKKTRIISVIVFCIYIAAVLVLCFMKPDNLPHTPFMIFGIQTDKIAHFFMFAPFPMLAYAAFAGKWDNVWKHLLLLAGLLAAGTAAAIATEVVQMVLGYRSADANDFSADMLGMAAGGFITAVYILFNKQRTR